SRPNAGRGQQLANDLLSSREAEASFFYDLDIVIRKADRRKKRGRHQSDPDKCIIEPAPKNGRDHYRTDDQHTAHCWRALLFLVLYRKFLANFLPDLQVV